MSKSEKIPEKNVVDKGSQTVQINRKRFEQLKTGKIPADQMTDDEKAVFGVKDTDGSEDRVVRAKEFGNGVKQKVAKSFLRNFFKKKD